ncbi:glycosyltransferase family 39 protein [Methanolobus sp. WCC4]|uniref:glycosyltransferase family 39 protein n=1 Tax=Methanolobus sp. WCC4 TaxID=3125784 RepID=UPI0030F95237
MTLYDWKQKLEYLNRVSMFLKSKPYFSVILVTLITSAIYSISFLNGHNWGGDFAHYILQAKALVDGNVNEVIQLCIYRSENSSIIFAPTLVAWGYPLLLAVVYYLVGFNILAFKMVTSLFFFMSFFIVYLLFREKVKDGHVLFLVMLVAFNPYFFEFKENVLTEFVFFFFGLLTIYIIQHVIIEKKLLLQKYVDYVILLVFLFFSYNIRAQGVLLLPTLALCYCIANKDVFYNRNLLSMIKRKDIYFFSPIIVLSALVLILVIHKIPTTNTEYFINGSLIETLMAVPFLSNMFMYFKVWSWFFSPPSSLSMLVYGMTLPFVIAGVLNNYKKDYLYILYASITLITLSSIHRPVFRYIITLFPFYMYFFLVGISRIPTDSFIPRNLNPFNWKLANIACIILILYSIIGMALVYDDLKHLEISDTYGPYSASSVEMFAYIKNNTSEEDVIVFWKPRVMTLYGDRRSILILNLDEFLESDARFVVYDKTELHEYNQLMGATIKDQDNHFKLVYENDIFEIFEINR